MKCPICKEDKPTFGERYHIAGEEVCADCYFDDFGNFIEKNPIGGHGHRRD
jgi:hypothetical protein